MDQNVPECERKWVTSAFIRCGYRKRLFCDTCRQFKADGVGWYKQTCSEGCEVSGAANGSAGIGFSQGHHAICSPLLLTFTKVLTQRGEHPDFQMNTHRLRAGTARRAHIDKIVQSGVIWSGWRNKVLVELYRSKVKKNLLVIWESDCRPSVKWKWTNKGSYSGDRKNVYFLWSRSCPLVILRVIRFLSVQLNSLGLSCEWR